MTEGTRPAVGSIGWIDLTIPDAPAIRDFYAAVVGWEPGEVDMGGYADFTMNVPASGEPVAGVCHARGGNEGLPACWLIYVVVADLAASVETVRKLGGTVVREPKDMGGMGSYAVIRDPAGACAALFQPA